MFCAYIGKYTCPIPPYTKLSPTLGWLYTCVYKADTLTAQNTNTKEGNIRKKEAKDWGTDNDLLLDVGDVWINQSSGQMEDG